MTTKSSRNKIDEDKKSPPVTGWQSLTGNCNND